MPIGDWMEAKQISEKRRTVVVDGMASDQAVWQYGGKSSVRDRLISSSGWIGFKRK